jgi:uncharacterized protein with PIN domain/sulfur carrier protein ThiS
MNLATFRFYAELNDFLPVKWKKTNFTLPFSRGQTVKHMVESCGVPHTEVDLVLVNGNPVPFSHQLQNNDRVSVYPVFECIDISNISMLRPQPLRHPRFVVDCHLGRLAVFLRLLGFDVLYRNDFPDDELAEISEKEKRICLPRDRGLLKRNQIEHGYLVRALDPRAQLIEVLKRFQLNLQLKPFTRCTRCNGFLRPVEEEEISSRLLPGTREHFHEFSCCESCGWIYWRGAQYERLQKLVDFVLKELKMERNGLGALKVENHD